MRSVIAVSIFAAVLIAGCVPRPTPPAPTPRPVPLPRPVPVTPAPAPTVDWQDAAVTPGTWTYERSAGGSTASFGTSPRDWTLRLTCRRTASQIAIERPGQGASALTIRTTSFTRTLPTNLQVTADAPRPPVVYATLAASDPVFDAMGFSRGRFMVEGGGAGALIVPAWAEVLRLVEDCRDTSASGGF